MTAVVAASLSVLADGARVRGVVGARGDLGAGLGEDLADRLDPVLGAVLVDVGDDHFSR
jgi:hypothetical protein